MHFSLISEILINSSISVSPDALSENISFTKQIKATALPPGLWTIVVPLLSVGLTSDLIPGGKYSIGSIATVCNIATYWTAQDKVL